MTDSQTITDLKRLVTNTEDYADMLINAMNQAKDALKRVTDLAFDEDLAKYGDDGKLTQCAADAIAQYEDMVSQCEDALKEICSVLVSPAQAAA